MNKQPEDWNSTGYDEEAETNEKEFFQPPAEKEDTAETARKMGLAMSAGITLFGSVVVLMGFGYVADLYFGSYPAAMIVGIVLGAIVGFYQFFRLSAQILKK